MPDTVQEKCIDVAFGSLLREAISGSLNSEDRDADRQAFEKHMRKCTACREEFVTHLAETKVMPVLEDVARQKGVTLEDLLESLRNTPRNIDN